MFVYLLLRRQLISLLVHHTKKHHTFYLLVDCSVCFKKTFLRFILIQFQIYHFNFLLEILIRIFNFRFTFRLDFDRVFLSLEYSSVRLICNQFKLEKMTVASFQVWGGIMRDEQPGGKVKLHDGSEMPMLGFGTYKVGAVPAAAANAANCPTPRDAGPVLSEAYEVGYRMFDCAQFYENEHVVGPVLKKAADRESLYILSKVWPTTIVQGPEAVKEQCRKTISDLQCDYLDMYMVHWPTPGHHVAAYKAIEELKDEGLVRSVAVSNYSIENLKELQEGGVKALPTVNQIEINPWMWRPCTINFCRENGIVPMAYRGLERGKATENVFVQNLCKRHNKTPAQILGRWLLQQGCVHIPKSENKGRMEENKALFDFHLENDEVSLLEKLTNEESMERFQKTHAKGCLRGSNAESLPTDFVATF